MTDNHASHSKKSRTIKVDYLARVEGEGALYIRYDDNTVEDVQLKIFEPPRFFEAFLQGRDHTEVPDITARICGICPVAYQMSSAQAIERALQLEVTPGIHQLRRLLYCGEWIESHVLHIAMLHAPDFLNLNSALEMADLHPEILQQALSLKKTGNSIVRLLGGREIHPVNVRIGGFYKLPSAAQLASLRADLEHALTQSIALTRWVATLTLPEFNRQQQPYLFVALHNEQEYPMNSGRLASSAGLDIPVTEFERYFTETHVAHSNALHCFLQGNTPYFVGPMARFNLNFDTLSSEAKQLASELGITPPYINPFGSIVVRALEVVHSVQTAIELIDQYQAPQQAYCDTTPKEGSGCAITEAPRGLLYHRYDIDRNGKITAAKIVPPTSQNQKTIEDDLRIILPALMHLDEEQIRHRCEQAIRNYDPCISCATHFLQLHLDKIDLGTSQ